MYVLPTRSNEGGEDYTDTLQFMSTAPPRYTLAFSPFGDGSVDNSHVFCLLHPYCRWAVLGRFSAGILDPEMY